MDVSTPRRRLLEAIGAGTAVSVAGCNALQNQQDGSQSDGSGGERTVSVAVQPDQQSLQEARQDISTRLQNGEISRQEAQQEFQETRASLLEDATSAFETNVSESDGVAVDDSVAELGVFLVTGNPGGIIDLLSLDSVSALLPESAFERAQSQQGATGPGTATQSG